MTVSLWMDAGFQNLPFLKSVTEKSAEGHIMLTDTFLPFSTRGLAKIGETERGMPRATCPSPVVVPAWPSRSILTTPTRKAESWLLVSFPRSLSLEITHSSPREEGSGRTSFCCLQGRKSLQLQDTLFALTSDSPHPEGG